VSIDADLQDDPDAIRSMMLEHCAGADVVYGVRTSRQVDSWFKRQTARSYYKALGLLGVDLVPNHADFRLLSRRAVDALREYTEVNVYLRGIVPQLGFKTARVYYERKMRFGGLSKYSLEKMLTLAIDGITSFSTLPLRLITFFGLAVSMLSLLVSLWALYTRLFTSYAVPGWASTVVPMYFLGGIQLFALGVIGEYAGKVYLEAKRRPRYIIEKII
jgi:polyisoprenyl-phosphate glycosyltransferase